MPAMKVGRERELVAQLRQLLFPSTEELVDECSLVKVETGGGLPDISSRESVKAACSGRRRHRGSSKRIRNRDEQNEDAEVENPASDSNNPQAHCSKRRKKQQQSKSLVTCTPDFDGYQWRKYGQKQIEGAMYARSYYRCTRSAEQGCPAKRTVQRNDDDDIVIHGSPPEYTVVYVGEHTCTANDDSMEAPVILETTAVTTNKKQRLEDDGDDHNVAALSPSAFLRPTARIDNFAVVNAPAAASGSSPASTTLTMESPATSEDATWSGASDHVVSSWMLAVDDSWAPSPVESSSQVHQQDMDDFTRPIRSPVHIAAGGWTIDQYLLLVNEPISHFSAAGFSF